MIDSFFDNFAVFTDAPNGIQKLRELILQLAVRGKLVPQDPEDEPASSLLMKLKTERGGSCLKTHFAQENRASR